jgi:excisionase family DNA binding protein
VGESALVLLMTPTEVSDYLGIPTGTLANWRCQGRGPRYVRVGRHVRYLAPDVHDWVLAHVLDGDDGALPARERSATRRV